MNTIQIQMYIKYVNIENWTKNRLTAISRMLNIIGIIDVIRWVHEI